jgi:hypothetical protein
VGAVLADALPAFVAAPAGKSAALTIEVAGRVLWVLAHLGGAALADALPASLAAPAWTRAAVVMVLAVLVWRALARPVGAALADALPASVAATICTSAAVVVTDVAVLARRARALYLAQRVGATLAEHSLFPWLLLLRRAQLW